MQASTFVRRTDAGSAELAAPVHGLSLTQRRFLTLLDTECSLEELALRHPGPIDKLERDLARLTMLGLVVCETPDAANDAIEAVQPANETMATPSAVRLGSRRLRPLAMAVSIAIVAALAWLGWQRFTSASAPTGNRAFNRVVHEAQARWRFAPATAGLTTMVDVAFKRD